MKIVVIADAAILGAVRIGHEAVAAVAHDVEAQRAELVGENAGVDFDLNAGGHRPTFIAQRGVETDRLSFFDDQRFERNAERFRQSFKSLSRRIADDADGHAIAAFVEIDEDDLLAVKRRAEAFLPFGEFDDVVVAFDDVRFLSAAFGGGVLRQEIRAEHAGDGRRDLRPRGFHRLRAA